MNEDRTARLTLPLLAPGQAQKEMSHNEALALIDIALHGSVVASGIDAPPTGPLAGQCWIVGDAPTGPWAGQPESVAGWTEGGWRFLAPQIGMQIWVEAAQAFARYGTSGWAIGEIRGDSLIIGSENLLAAPADSIAEPAGGATIDTQARACIGEILSILRHHRLMVQ